MTKLYTTGDVAELLGEPQEAIDARLTEFLAVKKIKDLDEVLALGSQSLTQLAKYYGITFEAMAGHWTTFISGVKADKLLHENVDYCHVGDSDWLMNNSAVYLFLSGTIDRDLGSQVIQKMLAEGRGDEMMQIMNDCFGSDIDTIANTRKLNDMDTGVAH